MWQRFKNIYHAVSALLASTYYGFPGKKLTVIGVTGTDGKTTTTHLIFHVLKTAGEKVSMVSSVYAEIGGHTYDTGFHVTTPNPWMLQKFLSQAVSTGDKFMVLEVTSHGLGQNRVLGIDFAVGVVTNITHEHLDYHKSYTEYLRTKEKLLQRAKIRVIGRDDRSYKSFNVSIHRNMVTYGIKKNADVTPKTFPFTTSLPGEYNRYNCLAAIATCLRLGLPSLVIRRAVKSFSGVEGRFEYVKTGKDFDVIIDFAHTPNAIEKVLATVKPMVKEKLIHVFGSAGVRDLTKRPIMGANSAKYADFIVLTEEDYRTEAVDQIIEEIAQGCISYGAKESLMPEYFKAIQGKNPVFFRIPDRQEAINFAIRKLARKGDTVILTGKAHEKSLCRGTVEYPWSEHEAIEKAIAKG